MNKILIFLISIILIYGCNSNAQDSNLIIGKWECYRVTCADARDLDLNGHKFNTDYFWEFTKRTYIDYYSEHPLLTKEAEYTLKDSTLNIGNSKWLIERLNNDTLIICFIQPLDNKISPNSRRTYFKKVSSFTNVH